MTGIAEVRCASCGWASGMGKDLYEASLDGLASVCATHLRRCPKRYVGHPAFGMESRWSKLYLADNSEVLEVAWTSGTWGQPFNLEAIASA